MPLVVKDRVKETSITAGTGTLTLDGAVAGFQSFAAIGNGNTTYYTIVDNIANVWEVGVGTYTSSGTTLSRDTVLANSLGNTSFINFASNSKDVFCTYPAGRSVYSDGTNITPATAATVLTTSGGTGLSSYTAGDLPYFAAGTAFTKLGIGAAGRFLTSTGSAPQWSDPTGVAVTSITFGTTGLTPATATQGAVTVAGTLITSNGGTGLSSYTAGDLPYYAAGTALTKLGIGSNKTILTSSGTAPQWTTSLDTTQGGTGQTTYTAGDLPYFAAGTAFTKLAIGSNKTILTSSGTAPQWTTSLDTTQGGTGQTSYTAGDLPYYAAGTSLTKLGIGAANTVMTSSGSAPQWSTTLSLTTITAQTVVASNGIFVNGATVSTSYTVGTGDNAMSAGTITIANGVTVTVSNGSRWVVV